MLEQSNYYRKTAERGIRVKILTPINEFVKDIIIQKILGKQKRIEVRYIGESLQSKVSIIVIDRKFSLVVELKDDTKGTHTKQWDWQLIPIANRP